MGFDHHGAVIGVLGVGLKPLGLGNGGRGPVHAVCAVDFFGDPLHPLTQGHIQIVQELQIHRILAGFHDHLGQLCGTLAAVAPVVGLGTADTPLSAQPLQQRHLGIGIGVEPVDADNRVDAGLLDGIDMVEQVAGTLFQQLQILLGVFLRKGRAGGDLGAAAVHLQGPDGGNQNGNIGSQAGQTALDVPEFFKSDVGGKAGLGDVIIKQLQCQPVGDDGGLADGDVGKGAGVDQHRLVLHAVAHGGVDGVAHPGGHGTGHVQILGGDGLAGLGVGHHDLADPLPQILQILGNGQNGHQLGADGNAELGLHHIAVQTAADADDDVPQALGAEVHDPAHFHTGGVDVQPLQTLLGQPLVGIVPLVLHPGIQCHHGQVMGIDNVIDIAGQAQGELGHGHQQGVAAAGRSTLDVHGGAAGGLPQCAAHVLAQVAQTLDQAQRNGGLTLAEGGGGDGGDFDELAVRLVLQAVHDLDKVDFRGFSIGNDLLGQKAQLVPEILHRGQGLFRFLSDLPVLVHRGIQVYPAVGVYILAVDKIDCHCVFLLRNTPGLFLRCRDGSLHSSARQHVCGNRCFAIGRLTNYIF